MVRSKINTSSISRFRQQILHIGITVRDLLNRRKNPSNTAGSLTMADAILLHAYKGKAKSANLSNKNLNQVPALVGRLSNLKILDLKNNRICSLPLEFAALGKVSRRTL